MNIKRIILIFIVFVYTANAKENYNSVIVDEITSIYDGDTFRVNIHSYPPIIGQRMSIRINGIDTPELRTKCIKEKALAIEAKQLTVSILRSAKVIELRNMKRGKYFRIIADVYADDKNIADILLKNDLAVRYNGGTKVKDWCE